MPLGIARGLAAALSAGLDGGRPGKDDRYGACLVVATR
jgi:hypothetical protein